MPRIARVVITHVAHHITQRGVRRINIFDDAKDKKSYIKILSELSLEEQLEIHAYCLMDKPCSFVVNCTHFPNSLSLLNCRILSTC